MASARIARRGVSSLVWAILGIVIAVAIGITVWLALAGAWGGAGRLFVEAKALDANTLEIRVSVPAGGSLRIDRLVFLLTTGGGQPVEQPPPNIQCSSGGAGPTRCVVYLNNEEITGTPASLSGLALKGGDYLVVVYSGLGASNLPTTSIAKVRIYTTAGTFEARVG